MRVFSEQIEVDPAVGGGRQNVLPCIPTLRYVVRNIDGDHSCQSCHASKLSGNVPSVPGFPGFRDITPRDSCSAEENVLALDRA